MRPTGSLPVLVATTAALIIIVISFARAQNGSSRAVPNNPAQPSASVHILFTPVGPRNPQDDARGKEILDRLKQALAKYPDYHAAEAAGYTAYFSDVPMEIYHFASKWRGAKEIVRFDPGEPTALLYQKVAGGYKLIGVMYYAPAMYSAESLDKRIPLSLARWHRIVNVCLAPGGKEVSNDPRFGDEGSISTKEECQKAGGDWNPSVHGWMAEVYPYEQNPERIWAYRGD